MPLTQKYAEQFGIIPGNSKNTMTSSFKTIGRDQKPMFNHRFIRDFNDLQYEIQTTLIRKTFRKQTSQQSRKSSKKSINNPENKSTYLRRSTTAPKFQRKDKNINIEDYELPQRMIQVESREKQITRDLKDRMGKTTSSSWFNSKNQQQISTMGLSEFEVEKTIIGKIAKRYSHHIEFQKQPNRPENINKVWYKKDTMMSSLDRDNKSASEKRIHPFKSDLSHKVFSPAESLDKFYPVSKSSKIVKKRDDIKVRDLQKMKDRDHLPTKPGTQLDYGKLGSLISKKMPIFRINRTERKLKISREVISPERGCYR